MKDNTFKSLSFLTNFVNFAINYSLKDDDPLSNLYQRFIKIQHQMNIEITHCYWLPQSAFNTTIPVDVNRQYIQYKNNSKSLQIRSKKTSAIAVTKIILIALKTNLIPYILSRLLQHHFMHMSNLLLHIQKL